jgi:hypothetical protein
MMEARDAREAREWQHRAWKDKISKQEGKSIDSRS